MAEANIAGADRYPLHMPKPLLEPESFFVFVLEMVVDRGIVTAWYAHHFDEANSLWRM